MSLPTYTKSWDVSGVNQRIVFASLNDCMAQYLYGKKNQLVAVRGTTVQWSCDGTTGPTNSSDHTDRWSSKSAATTRATVAAAAQSWIVIVFAGVQILYTYQGASDDIARISFSPGQNFALAGTTTNQPTASDECVLFSATSLINATASADRVWSMTVPTDNTGYRLCLYRQGTLIWDYFIEQLNPAPGVSGTPVVAGATMSGVNAMNNSQAGGCMTNFGSTAPGITRYNGVNISGVSLYQATINIGNNQNIFPDVNPPINGGAPIFPIIVASSLSGNDGWLGTRYDCFMGYTNGVANGDVYDDLSAGTRVMAIGAHGLTPWDPTKGLVTA